MQKPASVPVNDLKVLLSLARKQYLEMHDSSLPKAALLLAEKENCSGKAPGTLSRVLFKPIHRSSFMSACNRKRCILEAEVKIPQCTGWPERSVLQNCENQRKNRQRTR